jgi:ubiquinone/menaquinone biosynthesis C-methylase UbiE
MSDEYHLRELSVARDPSHPAHILPPPLPVSKKVLDVGCGAGQTLIAAYPDRVCFGMDIDFSALRLGQTLTDEVCFVCGDGAMLPWADAQFDMLICRVALLYTNIPSSLREFRRVLRADGQLWITLNPFSFAWKLAKGGNYKGKIFFGYVLLNSALFHFTGKQFPLFGKYQSFQTERGITRALKNTGFELTSIHQGTQHFLVTARVK